MYAARLLAIFVTVGITWEYTAISAFGQSNWSGSSAPQTTTNYDRYTQPTNSAAATITQQTQNAASNAATNVGNALRDGFDAGIRSAEQSMNSLGGQFQSSASSASGQSATGNAPRSTSGAPANGNGWSSIGNSVAAPPLIVPQSPMAAPNYNGAMAGAAAGTTTAAATGRNGPNFPPPPVNDPQSLRSMLADPSKSTTSSAGVSAPDWAKSWNNNSAASSATISRTNSQATLGNAGQDSNLVPVQGNTAAQGDPRTMTAARPNDNSWLNSSNNQPQAPAAMIESMANQVATNPNGAGPQLNNPQNNPQNSQFANNPNAPTGQFANTAGAQSWNQPNGQLAGQANGQMPNGQQYMNYPPANVNPNNGQMAPGQMNNGQLANNQIGMGTNGNTRTQAGVGTGDQPWVPMVLAVIGLAMSFAANLYLGASYLDARQKYQSLVRKTADTFRRVSAAAA